MQDEEKLKKCIAGRNTRGILDLMFHGNPPEVNRGYFKEDELWDYKEDIPAASKGTESDWAGIAADVLAFHNQTGGVLVFGIRNSNFQFSGTTQRIDTKLFNDKVRRYVGDRFWISFSREYIQSDQRYLGIAIVPPKVHVAVRALSDAPVKNGKQVLRSGDLCMRVGDETRVFKGSEALRYAVVNHLAESVSWLLLQSGPFRFLSAAAYVEAVQRIAYCPGMLAR